MVEQRNNPRLPNADNSQSPFAAEFSTANPEELFKLLTDPRLGVEHLRILLERKDLPSNLLEEIGRRRDWTRNNQVRRALAFHPRIPRTLGRRRSPSRGGRPGDLPAGSAHPRGKTRARAASLRTCGRIAHHGRASPCPRPSAGKSAVDGGSGVEGVVQ
jgi:hypothetical protein